MALPQSIRRSLAALMLTAACQPAAAQALCYHSGSTYVPASSSPSPLPLGCPGVMDWPMWRLFVPQHRTPTPHLGYRPGRAHAAPAIVVQYRCTGLLLAPIAVASQGNLGYVIDRPEHLCN